MVDHAWPLRDHRARSCPHDAVVLLASVGDGYGSHIFDQGYAGFPWLLILVQSQVRFLVRWKADYHLCDLQGHKKSPGRLTGRLRCWQQAPGWDAVHAVGGHEGLDHALLVPSHWCLDPSNPRALHSLTHRPQSALDCVSPFHPAPRPFFLWRCLPPLTRFGMNHVSQSSFEPGEHWGWCYIDRVEPAFTEIRARKPPCAQPGDEAPLLLSGEGRPWTA
jgi:hypothetical protein